MSTLSDLKLHEDKQLLSTAIEYAQANGILCRPSQTLIDATGDTASALVEHLPFSLYPSAIPGSLFKFAEKVQKDYNTLYAKVANDGAFLAECLES